MRSLVTVITVLMIVPHARVVRGQTEIAVNCVRISDRVAVFSTAAGGEATNVVALRSERGIVVVDTERSPSFTAAIRTAIEEEFSGGFRFLINTHGHGDHTYGNQIFAEATVLAHENTASEMKEVVDRVAGTVEQISAMLPRWKSQLDSLEEGSEQAAGLAGTIAYYEQMVTGLAEGFTAAYPTMTFADRMSLDLGDLTLELVWYGRGHSDSDIIIYCPEEQLLLTGDLFHTGGMPSYIDSERIPHLPRWREIIGSFLGREEGIAHIVGGHGEYLSLANLEENLTFITDRQELYAGRKSALTVFRDLHESEGIEAGLGRLREMFADPDHFYTLRPELDTYAYRLMLDEKLCVVRVNRSKPGQN